MALSIIDWAVLAIYLGAMSVWSLSGLRVSSYNQFSLHGEHTTGRFLVPSILATLVGGGTLVGMIDSGYRYGVASFGFALAVPLGLLLVAALAKRIRTFRREHGVTTIAEFMRVRFSRRCRNAAGWLNLAAFFMLTAAQFAGFAAIIHGFIGWGYLPSLAMAGVVLILYTALGGLRADIFTDTVQFYIMLAMVIIVILPFTLGWFEPKSIAKLGGVGLSSTFEIGVALNIILGFLVIGPSFVAAMDVWQRVLAADKTRTARRSLGIAAVLSLLFFVSFALLGIYARGSMPGSGKGESLAIGMLLQSVRAAEGTLGNVGLTGLMVIGLMALMQSTAGSMLLITSIVGAHDVFPVGSDEKRRLLAGRIGVVAFGVLAIVAVIVMRDVVGLLAGALGALGIMAPACIFGLMSRGDLERASFQSMIIGVGTLVLVLVFTRDGIMAGGAGTLVSYSAFAIYAWVGRIGRARSQSVATG
jgi:SSS family solute:Na+ symporter